MPPLRLTLISISWVLCALPATAGGFVAITSPTTAQNIPTPWADVTGLVFATPGPQTMSHVYLRTSYGPSDLQPPINDECAYDPSVLGWAYPIENWTDARYTAGALNAGIRLVAFQPPDPSISIDRSSFSQNFRFLEASSENGSIRAGHYYALFGQGLALNAYEERDVRVDTNLEGIRLEGTWRAFTLDLLSGTTVGGTSEEAERPRLDRLHGANLTWDAWFESFDGLSVTAGAAAVRLQNDDGAPENLRNLRVSLSGGPFTLDAEHVALDKPGRDGDGIYASASLAAGPLQLIGEVKDYDLIALRASGGTTYNLPPALVREQTYSLLNRHPHVLDPDDETGFQVEGVVTAGKHQLTGHYSETRNHDDDTKTNYFDEAYGELFLGAGSVLGADNVDIVLAGDWQKSFEGLLPDPRTGILSIPAFLELYTDIAEVRVVADDTHSFRLQYEHQHTDSVIDGEYDTFFGLLEWSRSPDLSFNVVGETSNRSDAQLEEGEEKHAGYGVVSYTLSQTHTLSLLYGRRPGGLHLRGWRLPFRARVRGNRAASAESLLAGCWSVPV